MRVTYSPPSIREFDILLKDDDSAIAPRGGALSDISVYVPESPRGGSIFGMLARLAKSVAPLIMRTVVPEGINFAKNVLDDVSSGQRVKQSLKRRGFESLGRVGKRIVRGGSKKGKKKKNKKRRTKAKSGGRVGRKKIRYNDVFDNI